MDIELWGIFDPHSIYWIIIAGLVLCMAALAMFTRQKPMSDSDYMSRFDLNKEEVDRLLKPSRDRLNHVLEVGFNLASVAAAATILARAFVPGVPQEAWSRIVLFLAVVVILISLGAQSLFRARTRKRANWLSKISNVQHDRILDRPIEVIHSGEILVSRCIGALLLLQAGFMIWSLIAKA